MLYLLKGVLDMPHFSLQRELCCTMGGRRAWFSEDVPPPTPRVLWGALQPSIFNFLLYHVMTCAFSNPLQSTQAPSGGKGMPWGRKRRGKQLSPAGNLDLAPCLVLVYREQGVGILEPLLLPSTMTAVRKSLPINSPSSGQLISSVIAIFCSFWPAQTTLDSGVPALLEAESTEDHLCQLTKSHQHLLWPVVSSLRRVFSTHSFLEHHFQNSRSYSFFWFLHIPPQRRNMEKSKEGITSSARCFVNDH